MLLCLPRHTEVDYLATAEQPYPLETLNRWKIAHEGVECPALLCGSDNGNWLIEQREPTLRPSLGRLQEITDKFARTTKLTAETVGELRSVINVLSAPMAA
jgi:hypothetical protein